MHLTEHFFNITGPFEARQHDLMDLLQRINVRQIETPKVMRIVCATIASCAASCLEDTFVVGDCVFT